MFQLIVAVISIALVAALAIASIYYGGSAFSSSSLRANVVTLVNGGQQIAGAQALYRTDFGVPGTYAQLTDQTGTQTYLSAAPGVSSIAKGNTWGLNTNKDAAVIGLAGGVTNATVCAEVVKQAGTAPQFGCGTSAGAIDATGLSGAFFVFKL